MKKINIEEKMDKSRSEDVIFVGMADEVRNRIRDDIEQLKERASLLSSREILPSDVWKDVIDNLMSLDENRGFMINPRLVFDHEESIRGQTIAAVTKIINALEQA